MESDMETTQPNHQISSEVIKTKIVLLTVLLSIWLFSAASAEAKLSRSEAEERVTEACQTTAEKRYGEDSIKVIGKNVKWKRGLRGAAINIKVKPKSKRPKKYLCVLEIDSTVAFYKN
jgi:hypothetical protein